MWLTASPHISTNTLSYLAKMRPFTTIKSTDTLLAVAEALANGHQLGTIRNRVSPYHDIALFDSIVGIIDEAKKELTNILTQGQLFQQVEALECD